MSWVAFFALAYRLIGIRIDVYICIRIRIRIRSHGTVSSKAND